MFLRSDTEKHGNNPNINTHNTYPNICSTDNTKENTQHVNTVTEKDENTNSSILNESAIDQLLKDILSIKESFEKLKTGEEPLDDISRDAKIRNLKQQVESCSDRSERLRNEQVSQARAGVINPAYPTKLADIRGHLALLKLISAGFKTRPRSNEYEEFGSSPAGVTAEYEDNNQSRSNISHEFQLPAAVPDRYSRITRNGTKKFVSITGKQMDRAEFNSIISNDLKNRKNREPIVIDLSKQRHRTPVSTPVSTPDASESKSYTNLKNKNSHPDFSHNGSPISSRNRSPDVNNIKTQSLRRQLCTSGFKSDDPKQELTISEYIRQKRSSSNSFNQKSATRTPSIVGPLDINLEQYYSNSQAYMNRFIKSIPENEVFNGLDHYTKYLLYGSNIGQNSNSNPNSTLNSDSDLPIKDNERIKMDKFSNNLDNFRLIIFTDSGLMFKQVLLDTKTPLKHSNEKDSSINKNLYHSQTELSSAMFGSSGLLINNSNSVTKIHFLRSLPNLKSSVLITRLFSLRSDFKSTKVKLDKKNNNNNSTDKDINVLHKSFRDLKIPNTRKNSQLSNTEDWNPNSTISLDDNPITDNSNVEITRYAIGVVVPLSTTCTSENISIETVQDLIGNNWNEIENNFASLEMALTEKLRQSRVSVDSTPSTPSSVGIADVLSSNQYFNMSNQDSSSSSPTNTHLRRPEFNPNREYDESKFLMNVDESQSSFNRLRRDSNLFDCFNELVASLVYLTESPRLYINLQSNASIISWASTLSAWLEFKDIKPKNSTLKYNKVGTKVPVVMDADSGFRFISLLIAILLPLRKDLFQSKPMDRTSNVTRRFVIATGNPIVSQKLIFILVGLLGYDSYEFICGDESEYIDNNSKDQRNATILGSSAEKINIENKAHNIQLTSAASTRPSSPVEGFHATQSSRSSSNDTIPIVSDNHKNEHLYESSSPPYGVGAIPIYSNNAGILDSRKISPPSGPSSDIAGSYGSISSLSHEGWGIPTKSTASISSSPVTKRMSYLSESYFEQQHHNQQSGNNQYQEIPIPKPRASLPLEPVQDCDTFDTYVYPEMARDPIKRTSSLASLQNISSSYGGAKPITIKRDQERHQGNDNSWSNPSSYLSRHSFSAGLSSLFDRLKGSSLSTTTTGSVNSDNDKIHNSASTIGLSQSLTGSSFNGKYSPGKIDLKGVNTYSNRLRFQRQGSDSAFRNDFPSPLAEYKQSPLDRATKSFNTESSRNIFRTLEYLPNMNRDAYSLTKVGNQNSEKNPVVENLISKKLISSIMDSTQKIDYCLNEKSNSIIADVSISDILSSKSDLHDTRKAVLPNVCGYIKQLRPEYSFMATSFDATSSKICDRIIEDDLKKTYLNLNDSELNESRDNKIYSQIICVSLASREVSFYEGSVAITPCSCNLSSESGNRDLTNTSTEVGETDYTIETKTSSTLTQAIRSSSASLYNNIMSSGTENRRKYEGCESNTFDPKMIKSRRKIIFAVKRKLIDNSQGVHKYDIKYDNQIVGRVDKLLSEIVDVTYKLEKATSIKKNTPASGVIRKQPSSYGKSNSYLGNADSFPSIYEDGDYFSSKPRHNSNSTVQEEDVSSVYDKDHNGYDSDNDTIYNYDPSAFTEEEAVAEIKRLIRQILSLAGNS